MVLEAPSDVSVCALVPEEMPPGPTEGSGDVPSIHPPYKLLMTQACDFNQSAFVYFTGF